MQENNEYLQLKSQKRCRQFLNYLKFLFGTISNFSKVTPKGIKDLNWGVQLILDLDLAIFWIDTPDRSIESYTT